jgi:hypothetical protein
MRTKRMTVPALVALGIGLCVLGSRTPAAEKTTPAKKPSPRLAGPWKPVAVLKVRQAAHLLEFSPDGKLLASGGVGGFNQLGQMLPGEITVWDVASR